jgi:holo-[acyl-carrier protein] synthase
MPTLCTGVDTIEIERVAASIERHGDHLLSRVYTDTERSVCSGRVQSLAARFAAKEAVAKALGTGIWREGIGWTDIEVGRDQITGAPVLCLHGAAQAQADKLGLTTWAISLSHDRERAIAFVVAMG